MKTNITPETAVITAALITETQLAEQLQASRRSVISWRMAGRIPHIRLGKHSIRYCLVSVIDHLRRTSPQA